MKEQAMKVLMVGPVSNVGGVANHTHYISKSLKELEIGITQYNTFSNRKIKLLRNIEKYMRRKYLLFKFLKKHAKEYDIIHTQSSGGVPALWSAQTVASFKEKHDSELKFVMTFHHSDTPRFVKEHHKEFDIIFRNLDYLIVVSNRQKEVFQKYFPFFKNISVIPNGYDADLFFPTSIKESRKKLEIPMDKKVLVNVAALEEYKGQRFLIEAMNKILKERKDVVLYIIGKGSLEDELRKLIKLYGLEKNIVLAGGNKPEEEMPLWFNACDIFVLPSLNESFGIVLLEAMACGKPVVATINGGSEEITTDEKVGLLVKAGDSKELAKAIEKALEMDWDSKYIIKFAERYEWENVLKEILAIYRVCLK